MSDLLTPDIKGARADITKPLEELVSTNEHINIVLIGLSGIGKSYFAGELASKFPEQVANIPAELLLSNQVSLTTKQINIIAAIPQELDKITELGLGNVKRVLLQGNNIEQSLDFIREYRQSLPPEKQSYTSLELGGPLLTDESLATLTFGIPDVIVKFFESEREEFDAVFCAAEYLIKNFPNVNTAEELTQQAKPYLQMDIPENILRFWEDLLEDYKEIPSKLPAIDVDVNSLSLSLQSQELKEMYRYVSESKVQTAQICLTAQMEDSEIAAVYSALGIDTKSTEGFRGINYMKSWEPRKSIWKNAGGSMPLRKFAIYSRTSSEEEFVFDISSFLPPEDLREIAKSYKSNFVCYIYEHDDLGIYILKQSIVMEGLLQNLPLQDNRIGLNYSAINGVLNARYDYNSETKNLDGLSSF